MIRNLNVWLSFLCFLFINGCAVALIGMGAGFGTAAYMSGEFIKTYESEYHETVQASIDTLETLKMPVTEKLSDELKTIIKAKRPDETPVTIEIVRIDRNHTEVSVRTGSVGVWDKRVSTQIQDFISEKLIQKTIDDTGSPEDFADKEIVSSVDETTEQKIIEEDLDNNSNQKIIQTESNTGLSDQTPKKKPTKAAAMLIDSVFIIFFNQNSNELSEKAIEKLDQVAEMILNNPELEIKINGYSDSRGSPAYNEMISETRANAVKLYFAGRGVNPSIIKTIGHGSQKFIASNKTAEGRQLNRRVEIELINP